MPLAHTLGLPYPGYLRTVLWRSVLMWILVRLFMVVFFAMLALIFPAPTLDLTAGIDVPAMGIPALLVWLDRRFYHELLLPSDLGTSELWLSGVSLLTVIALDVLAAVLLGLV